MFAVNKIQLNNPNAVSFKGTIPNNGHLILPLDPKERAKFLSANSEVLSAGFAEGKISLSQLLAQKIVSFWKLVTQDPIVARDAKLLEHEIRNIVNNEHPLGNKLDLAV